MAAHVRVGIQAVIEIGLFRCLEPFRSAIVEENPPTAPAMRWVEEGAVGWSAEVLRLAQGGMAMEQAQGAASWMLRIALTICSKSLGSKLEATALDTVRSILAGKDDGSSIAELVAARALLKERS